MNKIKALNPEMIYFGGTTQSNAGQIIKDAAYAFESAKVIIGAINKVCKNDRAAIRDAVLATKDFNGVLGPWSFDANGDTSLTTMSGNVVKDGKWEFVSPLKTE